MFWDLFSCCLVITLIRLRNCSAILEEWRKRDKLPGSYFNITTPNLLRCEKICERQKKCFAVSYDGVRSVCYLHEIPDCDAVDRGGRYMYKTLSEPVALTERNCKDHEMYVPTARTTGSCRRLPHLSDTESQLTTQVTTSSVPEFQSCGSTLNVSSSVNSSSSQAVCFDKDPESACPFRCRCFGDEPCDNITGHCESGCDPKWMGPSCQYGNLAYKRTVEGRLPDKEFTIDGNKTTCLPLKPYNDPAVHIDLGKAYTIDRLIIYNKNYETIPIRGLSIHVNTDNKCDVREQSLCYKTAETITTEVWDVQCRNAVEGRYVSLTSRGTNKYMSICEVEIYGGTNGAYGRPTELYIHFDPLEPDKFPSRMAVDGLVFIDQNIAHTRENTPDEYWFVDLEQELIITRIRLYYRATSDVTYYDRLNGFDLIILQKEIEVFREVIEGSGSFAEVIVVPARCGDNVTISSKNSTLPINVEEVEVYFTCPDGSFGLRCEKKCNCHRELEVCDKIDGLCSSGCQLGYTGNNCLTVCADGEFGFQCKEKCHCKTAGEVCDKKDGSCASGCQDGYSGVDCSIEGCDEVANYKTVGKTHGNVTLFFKILKCRLSKVKDNISMVCEKGERPMIVDTPQKQELTENSMDTYGAKHLLIGLMKKNGEWRWGSGANLNWHNWGESEPSGHGSCVHIVEKRQYHWYDVSCTDGKRKNTPGKHMHVACERT